MDEIGMRVVDMVLAFPALFLAIACNFIGHGIRDAMDPRINLR